MHMLILVVSLLTIITPSSVQDQAQPKTLPNDHIRELIQDLPAESKLRSSLESGRYGNGVHYPWMDKMREQGVKRATVVLDFHWRNHPADMKLNHIIFFDKYDSDCSQITNAERLDRIRQSGLEQALTEYAREETRKAKWLYVDVKPRMKQGIGRIELADDPWLPTSPAILQAARSPNESKLISLVALDDLVGLQTALQSEKFPARDLDGALFTSTGIDDSCIILVLLKAGANPNAKNSEGKTPLMYAARAGSIAVVRALLNAGATAQMKDNSGKTAALFAEEMGHTSIVHLLGNPEKRN